MKNLTRRTLFCLMCIFLASCSTIDERRIQDLEKRIEVLESSIKPVAEREKARKTAEQQRIKARERMRLDSKTYTREQLRKIETLYQVANKKWRTKEGKESLEKLIKKYDKANRTGCALLYLGQMSKGKERENYLQRAIEGFSDCFYGNGVQVGAYARFYLAYYYKENGKEEKAEKLFEEIKKQYPDAIDHKGRPLKSLIEK